MKKPPVAWVRSKPTREAEPAEACTLGAIMYASVDPWQAIARVEGLLNRCPGNGGPERIIAGYKRAIDR
jgi:hypothetical protein